MISNIQKIIFYIYNILSTNIENYFFYSGSKYKKNKLMQKGFEKNLFLNKLNLLKFFKKKIKGPNKYLNKYIVKKNKIEDLLKEVFIKNKLLKIIQFKTGFNYSIDFFTAYQTLPIPKKIKKKQIYANHWHLDKPFSKNTLKIIIPLKKITMKHGGMEILSKNINFKNNKNLSFYKMTGNTNEYLLFFPNICFHRAGNPNINLSRSQLMFQLNPAKNWCFKENLFELQFYKEPKFPLLKMFSKKKYLLV